MNRQRLDLLANCSSGSIHVIKCDFCLYYLSGFAHAADPSPIYLSTYLSIYLSIYLSTYLSIYLFIYLPIYLSIPVQLPWRWLFCARSLSLFLLSGSSPWSGISWSSHVLPTDTLCCVKPTQL